MRSLLVITPFVGAGMPKAYSRDLRERVIDRRLGQPGSLVDEASSLLSHLLFAITEKIPAESAQHDEAENPQGPGGGQRLAGRCCSSVSDNCCAPAGLAARPAKLARIAGTAALTTFCATSGSMPSVRAIFATISGVRNCMQMRRGLWPWCRSPLSSDDVETNQARGFVRSPRLKASQASFAKPV